MLENGGKAANRELGRNCCQELLGRGDLFSCRPLAAIRLAAKVSALSLNDGPIWLRRSPDKQRSTCCSAPLTDPARREFGNVDVGLCSVMRRQRRSVCDVRRNIGYFFINVCRGRLIVNMHPTPGTSRTLRMPSFSSTLRRAIDNPSPSPDLSAPNWVNGRNICSALPGGKPPP